MPHNDTQKLTQKRLKQEAKSLRKNDRVSYPKHADALDFIARHYKFPNWKAAQKACPEK